MKTRRQWFRPVFEPLEERMLLSAHNWTGGGGANTNWSNPANWDNGAPASNDDLFFPGNTGAALLPFNNLINDFPSGTTFHSISLGPLPPPPQQPPPFPNSFSPILLGNAIVLTGGVISSNPNTLIDLDGIMIGADQSFSLPAQAPELGIHSPINLNGFTLTGGIFRGAFSANGTMINGNLTGPVTLTGPSTFVNSTIDGPVYRAGGIVNLNGFDLTVDGTLTSSIVGQVQGGGSIIKNGSGTLALQGVISGAVNLLQGTLEPVLPRPIPFQDPIGPTLTTKSLTFSSITTFQVTLLGPNPGTDPFGQGYPQVLVIDPVNLNGATLSASLGASYTPTPGTAFVIMQSKGQITGTFNGLPDGASLTLGNQVFQIHYYNPRPGWPGEVVLSNDPRVTQTTAASSQTTAISLSPPTYTAAVAKVGGSPVNGAAPPAIGNVTFMEHGPPGTSSFGVNMPLSGPIPLVNGVATFTPLLTAGTHLITAVFNPADSTMLTSTSPTVTQVINAIDMGWREVMTGDFNGDGKQDIIGRSSTGQWFVAMSNGSGFVNQLWTTWNEAAGWQDVQVGDFNGDGKPDIAGRTAWGDWWVALSNGSSFTNSFWGHWNPNVTWVDVKVGDFNGDGKTDIVGRWLQAGQWWLAQSTGSSFTNNLWATWNPSATWVDVQIADFDGDKKTDLTGRWLEGGQWWTAISTGSSFTTSMWASWNPNVTWVDVKAGDFNNDGKADITGRWLEGGQWWTAISTGSSFTTTLWASWNPNVTWVDVQVGDFNGDGKADITGRWLQGGQWWTATSTGSSFTTNLWASWNPNVTWVDSLSADFTGDGKADLTSRYQQGGQWWAATSTGSDFATSLWTTWPA